MANMDAPIVQKLYDVYRARYDVVGRMPKRDKYTLGARAEQLTLQLLEFAIAASHATKPRKLLLLEQAGMKLDTLRVLLRLAEEVRAVPTEHALKLQKDIDEAGRMLGGWYRSLK